MLPKLMLDRRSACCGRYPPIAPIAAPTWRRADATDSVRSSPCSEAYFLASALKMDGIIR
jgi:hypothetical protein